MHITNLDIVTEIDDSGNKKLEWDFPPCYKTACRLALLHYINTHAVLLD